MTTTDHLQLSDIDGMLDGIGEEMIRLREDTLIPDDLKMSWIQAYQELMKEVEAGNVTPQQCSVRMSAIVSHFSHFANSAPVSMRLFTRRQSARAGCLSLIGKMIQFGKDFRDDVREKPAMIVGVNSRSVIIDNEDLTVGIRMRCDAWRMQHRSFLRHLESGAIRVMPDADVALMNLEKNIASQKAIIQELENENDPIELHRLIFLYAEALSLPLSIHESAAAARGTIIRHLQQSIEQDLERIGELT